MAVLFEKFKWGLELHLDFQGVMEEVKDIFQYQETLNTRHLNNMVVLLTIGALLTGFFGMNVVEKFQEVSLWKQFDSWENVLHFLSSQATALSQLFANIIIGIIIGFRGWGLYRGLRKLWNLLGLAWKRFLYPSDSR